MAVLSDKWYIKRLCCPDCGGILNIEERLVSCTACSYQASQAGGLTIKPLKPAALTVQMPRVMSVSPDKSMESIEMERPLNSYNGPVASRDSGSFMTIMQQYLKADADVLDLGCGPRDQAVPIEHLGYKYVGVDYSDTRADILADAHAIPFKNGTFDCILSYAVLEHLHNPFVALTEIERVLKPGGIYLGTVSQGEPFHDSYFHNTAWGFLSLISAVTEMKVHRLWCTGDTLGSLARMGRYPRVIKKVLDIVNRVHVGFPVLAPNKMKWSKNAKTLDAIHRAGSIGFVVQKK